jgi:hypothetical protein
MLGVFKSNIFSTVIRNVSPFRFSVTTGNSFLEDIKFAERISSLRLVSSFVSGTTMLPSFFFNQIRFLTYKLYQF